MRFWHNGILTPDVGKTIEFLSAADGALHEKWTIVEIDFPQEKMLTGDGGKLRAAFGRVGDVVIELLQPLDNLSFHSKALNERGPGFHHNAYICENNMDEVMAALLAEGGRKLWEFRNGDEHACYIEAPGGNAVLEIINCCPIMP